MSDNSAVQSNPEMPSPDRTECASGGGSPEFGVGGVEVDPPEPNTGAAVDFLMRYRGSDPVVLTAIVPNDGGAESETFRPELDGQRMRDWIGARQGRVNIYFTVNPCLKVLSGRVKAKKSDIRGMTTLHVDLDPRAGEDLEDERRRALKLIREFRPAPSFIIDSGGGFQGFWLLNEERTVDGSPERIAELEAYNYGMAQALSGDKVHNIDRIMRLPGTLNVPDKKKIKKGRRLALARLVEWLDLPPYDWACFKPVAVPSTTVSRSAGKAPRQLEAGVAQSRHVDLDGLPISDRCKAIIIAGGDTDNPAHFPSRSEALLYVCCELFRADVGDDIIHAIITDQDFKISASVLEKRNSEEYADRQISRSREMVGAERVTNRPTVMLKESELHRVLDEVEAGLLEMGASIYQMSGRLVHVERRDNSVIAPDANGERGALVVNDVSDHRLREYMIENIEFRRPDDDDEEGGSREAAPTLAHAKHLRARSDKWRLRALRGIVEAPTLRADGSLLAQEGYDDRSGYVVDFGGVSFPPIPETPSREDAVAALAMLKEPLAGFPFVVDADVVPVGSSSRSVALSAILTALCRRSLRAAPMHAFTAPTMATGKSMLADVVSIIATGRSATVTSQGKNEEEDEKRLLAILMQGDPIIVVDNVERPISGDALASILTQEQWQSRMLGMSRQIQVPTNVLFIATGNNLSFKGDMSTRAIVARLDAGMEAPETRVFIGDLRKQVRSQRPILVAAGLTILRAFFVAGQPGMSNLERFGRYEQWSDTVRGALIWLGEADPCLSRTFVAQRDLARDEHRELMEVWLTEFGLGTVIRAAELIQRADEDHNSALREVLHGICPLGPTAKRLGHYLTKIDGRWLSGLCIEQIPNQKQGAHYRLKSQTSAGLPAQAAMNV